MVLRNKHSSNVFINCPFDVEYLPVREAIIFAIVGCGYIPRSSLESDDSGEIRIDRIMNLIEGSRFGIHDISRTELDLAEGLPRFNMPLELGLFLGARRYGGSAHKAKRCLILDRERYRYQKFLSDISGQDIKAHDNDPAKVIAVVRNWLHGSSRRKNIPGGSVLVKRYGVFRKDLPVMCNTLNTEEKDLTHNEYVSMITLWHRKNI